MPVKDPVSSSATTCRSCGAPVQGKFCGNCGERLEVKRITMKALINDIFHLFTHLDKGFLYTLKQLIVSPGHMQRRFIEGERSRHQKPVSMFFICATVAAVGRYWLYRFLIDYYGTGNSSEAAYFHEYMVLQQILLMPLFIVGTRVLFARSKYNYAETGVMTLYLTSVFFIAAVLISLLKLIWPDMDTAYVELPLFIAYNAITLVNFYKDLPKWSVIVRSLILLVLFFLAVQVAERFVIDNIVK